MSRFARCKSPSRHVWPQNRELLSRPVFSFITSQPRSHQHKIESHNPEGCLLSGHESFEDIPDSFSRLFSRSRGIFSTSSNLASIHRSPSSWSALTHISVFGTGHFDISTMAGKFKEEDIDMEMEMGDVSMSELEIVSSNPGHRHMLTDLFKSINLYPPTLNTMIPRRGASQKTSIWQWARKAKRSNTPVMATRLKLRSLSNSYGRKMISTPRHSSWHQMVRTPSFSTLGVSLTIDFKVEVIVNSPSRVTVMKTTSFSNPVSRRATHTTRTLMVRDQSSLEVYMLTSCV